MRPRGEVCAAATCRIAASPVACSRYSFGLQLSPTQLRCKSRCISVATAVTSSSTPSRHPSPFLCKSTRLSTALENARVLPYPRSHEHKDLPEPYAKVTTSGRSTGEPQQRWGAALLQEEMGEAEYESLPTDNLWQHLLAGGMAGMMEHCFMYPVDCVKVSRVISVDTSIFV